MPPMKCGIYTPEQNTGKVHINEGWKCYTMDDIISLYTK